MARVVLSVFGAIVMIVALAVPARGAISARVPPRDSVVGAGFGLVGDPDIVSIHIAAESDASGGSPTGQLVFGFRRLTSPPPPHPPGPGVDFIGARVTCLTVDHNRAVIGAELDFGLGPMAAVVSDNGPPGGPPDGFWFAFGGADCSTVPAAPLSELIGDLQVRDAPTKDQCRKGGWRSYTDADGQPFRNKRACVAFALGIA